MSLARPVWRSAMAPTKARMTTRAIAATRRALPSAVRRELEPVEHSGPFVHRGHDHPHHHCQPWCDASARSASACDDTVSTINPDAAEIWYNGVDNACDGPYLYLRMLREGHPRANQVLDMITWNGGARNSSGVGIGSMQAWPSAMITPYW